MFDGLTIQGSLGILHGRECHNVVILAVLLNLDYLGLILFGQQVAHRLFVVDIRDEETVARLLLAARSRGIDGLLGLTSAVDVGGGSLLLTSRLSRG